MPTAPKTLPFTDDPNANELLARDPLALLIGFVLDQQVTVQKAFAGPLVLRERLGTLDAAAIASTDAAELERDFRTVPALHRYPAVMAGRVRALCAVVSDRYGGMASRIWEQAADGPDLAKRLGELPGIGPLKVATISELLIVQYGLKIERMDGVLPQKPTLGSVTTAAGLAAYQAQKRAAKRLRG